MFGNATLAANPTFKLVLGLGLCTLGGAMLYAYFKNQDDEEDEQQGKSSKTANKTQKRPDKKEVTVHLTVSNQQIPLIVGRGGANISLIEERTMTKIRFRDKDGSHQFCDITGTAENVKEARAAVLKEIERTPIVKEEIFVPQSVCGKIVGRCGEAMQEICRISGAKVAVDAGGRNGGMDKRRITITGNRPQVNIARKMIEDKIEEDQELQRAVEDVEQHREPRRSPTNSMSSSMYSSQTSLNSHVPPREKLMAARTEGKSMEVYVSAIASPDKFWVQLVGPQSKKLDDMVKSMTDYYNEPENRARHQLNEPYLGQIVAAIFKYDGKWYRAEIVGILPNEFNPGDIILDLYFVDYGDSEYVAPHEVFELRTDFLTLRFQAVECFLANVKSTLSPGSEAWDQQSIQKFEDVTQVATWKKLTSRVVTYRERPKPINGSTPAHAREGSPIPGVELYDYTEGVEVNIGHMLIAQGLALPTEEYRLTTTPPSSPDSLLHHSVASPQPSPKPAVSTESLPLSTSTAEDAFMEQQLQHLQKNGKLYLNGDAHSTAVNSNPAKLSFHNGNLEDAVVAPPTAITNGNHKLHDNLTR